VESGWSAVGQRSEKTDIGLHQAIKSGDGLPDGSSSSLFVVAAASHFGRQG